MNGKYYIFEDDELKTEEDDIGNTKVDINGNLLGGVFGINAHDMLFLTPCLQVVYSKRIHSVVLGVQILKSVICSLSTLLEPRGSEILCTISDEMHLS